MNTITFKTRHKSYQDMLEHLSIRHKQILEILKNKEKMLKNKEKYRKYDHYGKIGWIFYGCHNPEHNQYNVICNVSDCIIG